MFSRRLNVASLALVLAAAALLVGAEPAYACHEATGWCCLDRDDHTINQGDFCCIFLDNRLRACLDGR